MVVVQPDNHPAYTALRNFAHVAEFTTTVFFAMASTKVTCRLCLTQTEAKYSSKFSQLRERSKLGLRISVLQVPVSSDHDLQTSLPLL